MHRLASTVVCVVGPETPVPLDSAAPTTTLPPVLARLADAANVTVVRPDPALPAATRATAAWRECRAAATPYVVHDADPLADVAAAWVAYYDGGGVVGDLEVAVTAAVARFRRNEVDLPDSLLLVDPESWGATRRHWYLGVLGAAAPARVVPVRSGTGDLRQALGTLPTGRWWPQPPERLVDGIDQIVPDQFRAPAS